MIDETPRNKSETMRAARIARSLPNSSVVMTDCKKRSKDCKASCAETGDKR
jgi:hypothetical protein